MHACLRLIALGVLLAGPVTLRAQPTELPPPAPVNPGSASAAPAPSGPPSTSPAASPSPTSTPISAPPALEQVRFLQGDPNPNLNPKAETGFDAFPPPPKFNFESDQCLKEWTVSLTWLSGGDNWRTFGTEDLEANAIFQIPLGHGLAPLTLTPGGAIHFWQEPTVGQPLFDLGLPQRVYDLWLDVGWRPRIADCVTLDLGITPGFYADFDDDAGRGFRLRGRALGVYSYAENLDIVAGAVAINRVRTNWLPAGGVLWRPDPDTQVNLFFPAPKVAHRFMNDGCREWWLYLAGEYGGGAWAIRQGGWFEETIEYDDIRLNVGLECKATSGMSGFFEVGYVFHRRFFFERSGIEFQLDPTVMLRAGLVW